jgi:hypothetical protein
VPPCLSWLKDFYIVKTKNQCREGQQHISLDFIENNIMLKTKGVLQQVMKIIQMLLSRTESKFRDMPSISQSSNSKVTLV